MQRIIIIAWAGIVFGAVSAVWVGMAAPTWLEANWIWASGAYLLALFLVCRDQYRAQVTQRLLARIVRLERATVGLVFMHDDGPAHEAFLCEGRQCRAASPGEDIVRQARNDVDEFKSKALSGLFFPNDP